METSSLCQGFKLRTEPWRVSAGFRRVLRLAVLEKTTPGVSFLCLHGAAQHAMTLRKRGIMDVESITRELPSVEEQDMWLSKRVRVGAAREKTSGADRPVLDFTDGGSQAAAQQCLMTQRGRAELLKRADWCIVAKAAADNRAVLWRTWTAFAQAWVFPHFQLHPIPRDWCWLLSWQVATGVQISTSPKSEGATSSTRASRSMPPQVW